MYLFNNFLGTTGLLALSIISYEYFKLLLGKKLEDRLLLLVLCGTLAYLFVAAVSYLVFKEIIFYIIVIPVVLISFDLVCERKHIFSSKEKEDNPPPKESPLVGIKHKSRDGVKAIHPLLTALIILMLAYFFHVIFFVLGELVQ